MEQIHRLKDKFSVFYCAVCREEVFRPPLKNTANGCCLYRACEYCHRVTVVDPLSTDYPFIAIPLDENGIPIDRYIEREGT